MSGTTFFNDGALSSGKKKMGVALGINVPCLVACFDIMFAAVPHTVTSSTTARNAVEKN